VDRFVVLMPPRADEHTFELFVLGCCLSCGGA
jgi:hypothetical protein